MVWRWVGGSVLALAIGVAMTGCKTPAQVEEEKAARPQPIVRSTGPKVTPPGELASSPASSYARQTVITAGNVASFFNSHAFTIRTEDPRRPLLVILPANIALPPGRTAAEAFSVNERVQVSGEMKTYTAPEVMPGMYEMVPLTNRGLFDKQPVLVANDVRYLDLSYNAVAVSPSGVQVAKGTPPSTPPPAVSKTPVTVARTAEIRDVHTIVTAPKPLELVGRKVTLNQAVVVEVPSDKTFWVDGGNGKRFLCIVDEVNAGGRPQEKQMRIRVGDRLNLSGTMMKADPNSLPTRDRLTAKDKEALRPVQVFVWVERLSEKYL